MEDKMWLADYLKAYDELLYGAYKEKTPGDQFAADCRELKQGMSSIQVVMASIFELVGTFKILHEEAERWGETRDCRHVAWQKTAEMLRQLEEEQIQRRLAN
jgi:hypothetical protein